MLGALTLAALVVANVTDSRAVLTLVWLAWGVLTIPAFRILLFPPKD